jgi:large subunit ribosomal protein L6
MSYLLRLPRKNVIHKLYYVGLKKKFLINGEKGQGEFYFKFANFYINNSKNLEGFFSKLSQIKSLYQSFKGLQEGLVKGFYAELILRGIGFKVYFLNGNKLLFSLGYSHFILYDMPVDVIVYIKKGKLFLYSLDKEKLGNVVKIFKNFRIPDAYKAKGIVEFGQFFSLKEGKKR